MCVCVLNKHPTHFNKWIYQLQIHLLTYFFLLSREELNSKVLPEQSIFEAHGDIKLSGTMPIPRGRKLYWPGCSN